MRHPGSELPGGHEPAQAGPFGFGSERPLFGPEARPFRGLQSQGVTGGQGFQPRPPAGDRVALPELVRIEGAQPGHRLAPADSPGFATVLRPGNADDDRTIPGCLLRTPADPESRGSILMSTRRVPRQRRRIRLPMQTRNLCVYGMTEVDG